MKLLPESGLKEKTSVRVTVPELLPLCVSVSKTSLELLAGIVIGSGLLASEPTLSPAVLLYTLSSVTASPLAFMTVTGI